MQWKDILHISNNFGFSPTQVLQEQLQKAILSFFSQQNAFNKIVFQGGTALRLIYGNPRFSEDLDFVHVPNIKEFEIKKIEEKLLLYLSSQFTFLDKITGNIQKKEDFLQRYIVKTNSANQKQCIRLHIEIVNIPSYDSELRILSFPPIQPVIRVESEREILADKLLALFFRKYLKGRDLWDIYFLTKQKNIFVDWNLTRKKSNDYKQDITSQEKIEYTKELLKNQGVKVLDIEMKRFLPPKQFSSCKEMFPNIVKDIISIIESLEYDL